MFRAFAYTPLNKQAIGFRDLQIGKRSIKGCFKVAKGINKGAIQVNHDGFDVQLFH
jgi:hypothetical protein